MSENNNALRLHPHKIKHYNNFMKQRTDYLLFLSNVANCSCIVCNNKGYSKLRMSCEYECSEQLTKGQHL